LIPRELLLLQLQQAWQVLELEQQELLLLQLQQAWQVLELEQQELLLLQLLLPSSSPLWLE